MILPEVKKEYLEAILQLAKKYGVKYLKIEDFCVELFESKPESMQLDPVSLSKSLSDSMPPDSAMLFASSEDLANEENLMPKPRENSDMK